MVLFPLGDMSFLKPSTIDIESSGAPFYLDRFPSHKIYISNSFYPLLHPFIMFLYNPQSKFPIALPLHPFIMFLYNPQSKFPIALPHVIYFLLETSRELFTWSITIELHMRKTYTLSSSNMVFTLSTYILSICLIYCVVWLHSPFTWFHHIIQPILKSRFS